MIIHLQLCYALKHTNTAELIHWRSKLVMVFVSVPCKKGADVDLVKPIEHYIKGNLGSGQAAACKKGLDHLQKLRNDILAKLDDSHDSTVKLIES